MSPRRPTLLVTSGDPAGIGPEIVARVAAAPSSRRLARLVVAGDPEIFERAIRHSGVRLRLRAASPERFDPSDDAPGLPFVVTSEEGWRSLRPGEPTAASGRAAALAIETAARLAMDGRVDAVVTAPISKTALRLAGYPFPGHTEFLGALTGSRETRMLFVGRRFRVLLATVHLPLRAVPDAVTIPSLARTLEFAGAALRNFRWGARRAVAVLGMNPHAGEQGMFGDEEARVIAPAIEQARARGIAAEGPYPADTFFARGAERRDLGVVVALYHDQGLIAAKADGVGGAANVTLGLPFVRSSVDHGTAFDRAWKGRGRAPRAEAPSPAGLATAVRVGADLARRAGTRPMEWAWP